LLYVYIGTSLGSLLGGFIFETYGGSVMFRYFGIYALAYGVVYYLIHVAMDYFGVGNYYLNMESVDQIF